MDKQRRAFFKQGLGAAASVTLAQLVYLPLACADDLPHVDEAGAQAVGLGYKHDATQVDSTKYPRYQAGTVCSGCVLYTGKTEAEWGGCSLFAGQVVAAKGWCSVFAPKA